MNAAPGVRWTELGDWLAPLNRICDFQLLLVGAACFGFGAIAAMKVNSHVAPFAANVGFATSVSPGSLLDATKQLYRSVASGDQLKDAVLSAQRELRSAGEKIQYSSAVKLGIQVLQGVYDGIRTPQAMSDRVQNLLKQAQAAGLPVPAAAADVLPIALERTSRLHAQRAWDCWFPQEVQERDASYRLDWTLVEADWPAAGTVDT